MPRYLIPPSPADDLPPPPPGPQDFNIPDEAWAARTAFGWLEPGEPLDPAYRQEADRANATRAMELQNQFLDRQRASLSTGPDAFFDRRGREAVLGANDVLSRLQDARREVLDQTANPLQRRLLQDALDRHAFAEHADIGDHVGRQSLQWQNEVATSRLDHLCQQAALDHADPDAIAAYEQASESAARDRARTLGFAQDSDGANAEVSTARSSIWRSAIEAALGRDATKPAIALYDRAIDRLTPADTSILARYVEGARERETGRDYVASLPMPEVDPSSPLDAEKCLATVDAAHAAATAQNESDWPDDASQRATNQHFIDVAFGQKKRGIVQSNTDLEAMALNWVETPKPNGEPQTDLPPPNIWIRLGDDLRKTILAILMRNASGGADTASPITNRENITKMNAAPPSTATTAPPLPGLPLGEGANVASNAAKALAPLAGRIGASALAAARTTSGAVPLILIPTNSQAETFSLGDGLRARHFGDSESVGIERRVDHGLFGTGIGAKWEDVDVRATLSRPVNGRRTLLVDPAELERAIGPDAARQALAVAADAPNPQVLPPPVPWMVEMHVSASTNRAKTFVRRDVTAEEVETLCRNYPNVYRIALEASRRAQATGLPNGLAYGRFAHLQFKLEAEKIAKAKEIMKENGIKEMLPEQSLFKGERVTYSSKGSYRVDLMETYPQRKTVCIYELKTGKAWLSKKKLEEYGRRAISAAGKGYTHVYAVGVHVQ
jgi:hypothetical protein